MPYSAYDAIRSQLVNQPSDGQLQISARRRLVLGNTQFQGGGQITAVGAGARVPQIYAANIPTADFNSFSVADAILVERFGITFGSNDPTGGTTLRNATFFLATNAGGPVPIWGAPSLQSELYSGITASLAIEIPVMRLLTNYDLSTLIGINLGATANPFGPMQSFSVTTATAVNFNLGCIFGSTPGANVLATNGTVFYRLVRGITEA